MLLLFLLRVSMISLTEQGACTVTEISEQMNRYFQEVFSCMAEFARDSAAFYLIVKSEFRQI